MAHPFPTTEQPLRTLTDAGVAHYRKLNDRDEKELELLRQERAKLAAEMASIDDVAADLHETIGRRQAKMRGDIIQLLPGQADPFAHQVAWDGFVPPETGSFASVPDLSPDPEKNLRAIGELHDAQNAREGAGS